MSEMQTHPQMPKSKTTETSNMSAVQNNKITNMSHRRIPTYSNNYNMEMRKRQSGESAEMSNMSHMTNDQIQNVQSYQHLQMMTNAIIPTWQKYKNLEVRKFGISEYRYSVNS